MDWRILVLTGALLAPTAVVARGGAFTAIHPEEAIPDPQIRPQSGPYSELINKVQERLNTLGFDAGPVNGEFGEKTQAALAQFQLGATIPASGQLDERTLAELGIKRPRESGAS